MMEKLFRKGEQRCCYQKKKESGEDTGLTITSEYTEKVNGQEEMKRGQLKGTKYSLVEELSPSFCQIIRVTIVYSNLLYILKIVKRKI